MTPIEKAENALNGRIEQIQANLHDARTDAERRFLIQALMVCVGIGEGLRAYIRMIGQYAQLRHGELKQTHDALTAQHADRLTAGKELLERLKTNPSNRAILKEIEQEQKAMAVIQKTLRRGANALQREVAPGMAVLDQVALSLRRLGEADELGALKRVTHGIVELVRDFYRVQPTLPAKDIIDAASWEKSVASEIDQAADFYEAYACAGYQAMLALELMSMAVSNTPPRTADEATRRANESVAARLKEITARFTAG